MHPDNKDFISKLIDKYPVSVHEPAEGITSYEILLPDNQTISISTVLTTISPDYVEVYYAAGIEEKLIEEAYASSKNIETNKAAMDFVDLLRKCSAKIIMQEMHKTQSTMMVKHITNKKTLS